MEFSNEPLWITYFGHPPHPVRGLIVSLASMYSTFPGAAGLNVTSDTRNLDASVEKFPFGYGQIKIRCKVCTKRRLRSEITSECRKCLLALHIPNCFGIYHFLNDY
uniref:Uncharacterized protein n=1 Tax=Vespula pensylvanica TaxID=30213 RepID=A0A834P5G2_VESPE|nr:hypothetical protein H0235_005763 [Vespula pensylvanica]